MGTDLSTLSKSISLAALQLCGDCDCRAWLARLLLIHSLLVDHKKRIRGIRRRRIRRGAGVPYLRSYTRILCTIETNKNKNKHAQVFRAQANKTCNLLVRTSLKRQRQSTKLGKQACKIKRKRNSLHHAKQGSSSKNGPIAKTRLSLHSACARVRFARISTS